MTIYYWPCGTWCSKETLEEHLTYMSDDFTETTIDAKSEVEFEEKINKLIKEN